ncbi:MAG TPA: DUF3800 domain-containing protein [Thermoanaerobaculia bacterium]|nr:DUF3800 domain-containing protein [Thermoanaerobaculia bacterium]
MYLLYVDESGVADPSPSQTSHYVALGLAVHVGTWFALTRRVKQLKRLYALEGDVEKLELHAAWLCRPYWEQDQIPGFADLSRKARYDAVMALRYEHQLRGWPHIPVKKVKAEKKDFRKTEPFVHLTLGERRALYLKALSLIGEHRRGITLFGEALDKSALPSSVHAAHEAFSRLIDRFEVFLKNHEENPWGIVVVDRDEAHSSQYAELLARFQQRDHSQGGVDRVIEAPFFLDSRSNSGVQVADLCVYALRRYLENGEEEPFRCIFSKFFRMPSGLCGLRHFTNPGCSCLICAEPSAKIKRMRRRPGAHLSEIAGWTKEEGDPREGPP